MIKSTLPLLLKFLYVVLGIILLSSLTSLFSSGIQLEGMLFIKNIKHIIFSFIHPEKLVVVGLNGASYSIFPTIWPFYKYTLILFFCTFLLSIAAGITLSYLMMIVPGKVGKWIVGLTSIFESLPDIFTLIVLQLIVIKYFEATGDLLFPIAGSFGDQPIVLPILILSIIPSIQMFSIINLFVKEELGKPYIALAKSKGYHMTYIFFIHLMRNIIPTIFNHSKSIILLILSNLVVLERLFNLQGLNTYLFTYPESNIIAFSLIMLYLPIFGMYLLINVLTVWKTGQRVEM